MPHHNRFREKLKAQPHEQTLVRTYVDREYYRETLMVFRRIGVRNPYQSQMF